MKRLVLWAISRYRSLGGGMVLFRVDCNFEPSCSAYAYDAITRYGLLGGGRLAIRRISSCKSRDSICKCIEPVPESIENAETE